MEASSSLCPQDPPLIGTSQLPILLGQSLVEEFRLIWDGKHHKGLSKCSLDLGKVPIRSNCLGLMSLCTLQPIIMFPEIHSQQATPNLVDIIIAQSIATWTIIHNPPACFIC